MPYKDKEAQKRAQHRSYLRNKDKILSKQQAERQERNEYKFFLRQANSARLREIKESTPCTDCGKYFKYYQMDPDHIDRSTKVATISDLIAAGCSWNMIQTELDKCELVCANCHRERTHQRGYITNDTCL